MSEVPAIIDWGFVIEHNYLRAQKQAILLQGNRY